MQKTNVAAVSRPELRAALDGIVATSLPPVTAGLSGLYAVFAVSHWLLLPEASAFPLASVAASTAGVLAAFWLVMKRWALPATWAHAAGAGIAGLVLLNSLLHLVLLGEAWQTTNLVLLVMGVGFFFLSTRWLTIMLVATGLGWGGIVWVSSPSPLWLHFGFALLTAGVLAVLVHTIRLRTYRGLVQLSLQDAERLRVLEATARMAQYNAERFRQIFQHSSDAIFVIDPSQETIIDANGQACQLLGYTHAEFLQIPLTALYRVEDIPTVRAFVQATLDHGQGWTNELVCLTKTGAQLACEISAASLSLENTRCIISSIRDITKRQQAEEALRVNGALRVEITQHEQTEQALRESEARYRDLIESTHDMIQSAALDGRMLLVNWAWLTTLGYEPSDVSQLAVLDNIHPDSHAHYQQVMTRVAAGESVNGVHVTFVTKEGRAIPVEGNMTACYVAGTLTGTQGFFRDVSERAQAQAALHQQEEYFRALIENASDVLTVMGGDGTFQYQSPVAEQLLGHRLADAGRQAGFPFVHPDDTAKVEAAFVEAVQQPQVKIQTEFRMRHQDGSWRTVEATALNLLDTPAVGGIVVNLRDITERKQTEAALRQSKEAAEAGNRTKSEFLAMMSHELRTPLHIILGYTELLAEGAGGALPAEALAMLAKVHLKAGELVELITVVLDVSQMETGQLAGEVSAVAVAELLAELRVETQDLQEQSGLDFVWQIHEPLPSLATDPGKLKIVLKNLIGNAVKFTAQGHVSISAQAEPGGVAIAVADTGIGIPAEALSVIFEPFRQVDSSNTRQHEGVGLGLHIVKRLVTLLGGTVTVESTIGQGTMFRVWLPAAVKLQT